ncbi:MAG: MarC family protein [Candidatus Anstonellales archaeon]
MEITQIISAFIIILVIMDPFASLPIFLTLTKGAKEEEIKKAASEAVLIAGILAVLFVFIGQLLFAYLGITLGEFKIAGGIALLLLGVQTIFDIHIGAHNKENDIRSISILIATPVLTGPGLMTALVVLSQEMGFAAPLVAVLVALAISWVILYNANFVKKIIGKRIVEVSSKVFGLITLALGVAYIKSGIIG